MDEKTSRHFAEIIELAESVFENVVYEIDATPDRSILRVEAGFDNAPDPRAIRLKYEKIGEEHTGENVPHLHREDKTQLYLNGRNDLSRLCRLGEEQFITNEV